MSKYVKDQKDKDSVAEILTESDDNSTFCVFLDWGRDDEDFVERDPLNDGPDFETTSLPELTRHIQERCGQAYIDKLLTGNECKITVFEIKKVPLKLKFSRKSVYKLDEITR